MCRAGFSFQLSISPFTVLSGAQLDSVGWPTVDFTLCFQYLAPGYSSTTLKLSFTGQATLGFVNVPSTGCTITNQTWNSGTNVTTADILYASGLTQAPQIAFTNSKRLNTDTPPTGCTNMDIRLASYVGNTNFWTTEFKNYVQADFGVLRTMDIIGANTDFTTTNWASRTQSKTTCNDPTSLIALANETGKALWYNIPTLATDDYVTNLATLMLATLTAPVYIEYTNEYFNNTTGVQVHVLDLAAPEVKGAYGNGASVRNITAASSLANIVTLTLAFTPDVSIGDSLAVVTIGGAGGGTTCTVTAVNTISNTISYSGTTQADGSLTINSSCAYFSITAAASSTLYAAVPNVSTIGNFYSFGDRWMQRRITQISDLFRAVVGSQMMVQYRPVYMDQAGNDGTAELDYISTVSSRAGFSDSVSSKLYMYGSAPYWDIDGTSAPGGINLSGDTSVHTIADYVLQFQNSMAYLKVPGRYNFSFKAMNAARYGIQIGAYEGGPDASSDCGSANNILKQEAKFDPGFASAVGLVLADMEMCGYSVFNQYTAQLDPLGTSSVFAWGFTDSYADVTNFWQAYKNFNSRAAVPRLNLVTSVGTTVIPGYLYVGNYPSSGIYVGSTTLPGLYSPNKNYLPYLINCDAACTKTLNISAGCNFTPQSFQIEVNNVVVATIAFINNGSLTSFLTYGPTTVTLRQGINSIRIIATVNHGGPSNNEAFNTLTFS